MSLSRRRVLVGALAAPAVIAQARLGSAAPANEDFASDPQAELSTRAISATGCAASLRPASRRRLTVRSARRSIRTRR